MNYMYSYVLEDTVSVIKQIFFSRMDSQKEILFTKKMRIATREIHGISDALINAKIGFGKAC